MYNKVEIEITRLDENGNSVKETKKLDKNGKEVSVVEKLSNVTEIKIATLVDSEELVLDVKEDIVTLNNLNDTDLKQKISEAETFKIVNGNDTYVYSSEENIVEKNGISLGKGVISIKVAKPKKSEDNQFKIEVIISSLKEKDSEITPYDSEDTINQKIMSDFLNQWVKEPYSILEYKTGCEINFNKAFPKTIEMRKSSDILAELDLLDKEFGEI